MLRQLPRVWLVCVVGVAALSVVSSGTVRAGEATTRPAGGDGPSPARVGRVELAVEGREAPFHYWLQAPAGYGPSDRPTLLICLHGTDDSARDALDFWSGLTARLPMLVAAPQGIGPGWRDEDLPAIRAMLEHLRETVPYDRERVMLAGFSAGGAMTFHLLYAEGIEVTAAAALANYVPPRITDEQIAQRRGVPAFYAVGMADVNHERMREGLRRLRSAGASVELYRPRIGHVLDPRVGQAALDWLFEQCGRKIDASIEDAQSSGLKGRAAATLEGVVAQAKWHEPAHVERARTALAEIEAKGRAALADAERLVAANRRADAAEALRAVDADYSGCALGEDARRLRLELEADPAVREELAARESKRRAEQALRMYADAQEHVAGRDFHAAAEICHSVIRMYGDTPAAGRAKRLLDMLPKGTAP